MKVEQLMTRSVETCTFDDTLATPARIMWEKDCGAVPVVDAQGRAVGIVTDRDICMAAYTQGKPLTQIPVSTAAAHTLISAAPDTTIEEVEALMRDAQIRRVPVLDEAGRPTGMLALADIARGLSSTSTDGVSADPIARTLAAIAQPHALRGSGPAATPAAAAPPSTVEHAAARPRRPKRT